MSVHSGFLYYYDLLGLNRDSLRVHYRFDQNSGVNVLNDAPNFPQMGGVLNSVGNFYSNSGSGHFEGQSLAIQNGTGLPSDFWSHIWIYEKTGKGKGVFFDSLMTGEIVSGYILGVNDANKLYFESYDENGPFTKTSSLVLGKKNLVAAVKSNNLLTFYCYDFNNDLALSENHSLLGEFVLPSTKGVIGHTSGSPNYVQTGAFKGFVDEYVVLQESVTPSTFRYLVSGLVSQYELVSGAVTYFTGVEVTGYLSGITGVTGITGYANQITGSGLDPFGTGNYQYFWGNIAQTGYLASGVKITPLTGNVVRSLTGDPVPTISLRTGYMKDFNLDEVSYIKRINSDDISYLNIYPIFSPVINLEAGFDSVLGKFQVDRKYARDSIELYVNGIAQLDTGFYYTGNAYRSGVVLSGDYRLDGYYVDATGFFNDDDILLYDRISGARQQVQLTGAQSGITEALPVDNKFIYYNGVLLLSGVEYRSNGGNFQWATSRYDGETGGKLTSFPRMTVSESLTGIFFSLTGSVARRSSQLFFNGQRQLLNKDYIENSALDLIDQSGIFETSVTLLYNDDDNFFEDFGPIYIFTSDSTLITTDSTITSDSSS